MARSSPDAAWPHAADLGDVLKRTGKGFGHYRRREMGRGAHLKRDSARSGDDQRRVLAVDFRAWPLRLRGARLAGAFTSPSS